ncbi:MAG: hypothetical protein ACREJ0_17945 [Geminicoccaceae bacterium]
MLEPRVSDPGAPLRSGPAGGCRISAARYVQAAIALGGHGKHVADLADLDAGLDRAIASERPACVNVAIEGSGH